LALISPSRKMITRPKLLHGGPKEADPRNNRISHESPIGGPVRRRAGDTITHPPRWRHPPENPFYRVICLKCSKIFFGFVSHKKKMWPKPPSFFYVNDRGIRLVRFRPDSQFEVRRSKKLLLGRGRRRSSYHDAGFELQGGSLEQDLLARFDQTGSPLEASRCMMVASLKA